MVMWSFGQCHTGTISSGQLPKADPPNGEKNPWSTVTSERRAWMSSSYKGCMWSQAGESDLPWGGWLDVVWQSPDAQGWDSGHGSIGISRQVPEGTLFVIREALISQCPSAAPWMPGSTRKKEEGITRRATASRNLYSLFAANKTKTGALESVKLWMLGYQLTGLFPTRMPGQGFPSHVKSAASAFTASQVQ